MDAAGWGPLGSQVAADHRLHLQGDSLPLGGLVSGGHRGQGWEGKENRQDQYCIVVSLLTTVQWWVDYTTHYCIVVSSETSV